MGSMWRLRKILGKYAQRRAAPVVLTAVAAASVHTARRYLLVVARVPDASMYATASGTMMSNAEPRPMKRGRPPKLSLGVDGLRNPATNGITIESVLSPIDLLDGVDESEDTLVSPTFSSACSSPIEYPLSVDSDSDVASDDLSKDMEMLEKLRRNVHKNLKLRPLRASPAEPDGAGRTPPVVDTQCVPRQAHPKSPASTADSAAPSPAFSIYYTPTSEFMPTPLSARYAAHSPYPEPKTAMPSSGPRRSPVPTAPAAPSPLRPRGIDFDALFQRLSASRRPLVIDTRQPASYLASRLKHSLNIAIPSLIMRRCTKPGGRLPSLDAIRTHITTDRGKEAWDELMRPGGVWDGDVVVYDEDTDEQNRDNPQLLPWAMLSVLQPLVENGVVEYLKGGISAARSHPSAHHYIITGEPALVAGPGSELRTDGHSPLRKGGLFQLDTNSATRSKAMPEIEPPSASPTKGQPSSSPRPMLCDLSPSPSPSTSVFPQHSKSRKASIPNLCRIDTSSAERLVPKLTVRTLPVKANTLAAPTLSRQSSSSSLRPNSPSHLTLSLSNKYPSGSRGLFPPSANSSCESLHPPSRAHSLSPRTPTTPTGFPSSPRTARPDLDAPPTTEDPFPAFSVSTILPNFLFLGPELTQPEHVDELLALGVKRILNIAAECNDDQGLNLRDRFEKYTRIPMRDTVEEENVSRSVHEACEALGKHCG